MSWEGEVEDCCEEHTSYATHNEHLFLPVTRGMRSQPLQFMDKKTAKAPSTKKKSVILLS